MRRKWAFLIGPTQLCIVLILNGKNAKLPSFVHTFGQKVVCRIRNNTGGAFSARGRAGLYLGVCERIPEGAFVLYENGSIDRVPSFSSITGDSDFIQDNIDTKSEDPFVQAPRRSPRLQENQVNMNVSKNDKNGHRLINEDEIPAATAFDVSPNLVRKMTGNERPEWIESILEELESLRSLGVYTKVTQNDLPLSKDVDFEILPRKIV